MYNISYQLFLKYNLNLFLCNCGTTKNSIKFLKQDKQQSLSYSCHTWPRIHVLLLWRCKKNNSVSRANIILKFFLTYSNVLSQIVSRRHRHINSSITDLYFIFYFKGNCYGKYVSLLFSYLLHIACTICYLCELYKYVKIVFRHNLQLIARKLCQCQVR